MSLEVRDAAVSGKKHDLSATHRAHRSKLRALRSVTRSILQNAPLSDLINLNFDLGHSQDISPSLDCTDESAWLDSNDLSNGHYFNEASLPFHPTTRDDDFIYTSKPTRPSTQAVGEVNFSADDDATAHDGLAGAPAAVTSQKGTGAPSLVVEAISDARVNDGESSPASTYAQRASQHPDGPVARPSDIAPPEPEEEADLSARAKQVLDDQRPSRPARVIHLPSLDEQEQFARSQAENAVRPADQDQSQSQQAAARLQSHTDLASSPSSTVGPYSAATPVPAQDSPDTSPDSVVADELEDVEPPKELRLSPEEQREKEEHDRLLEAQKDLARKAALGDVSTADEQLRWEEREAAAREAEERAARQTVEGPEPNATSVDDETQANEVMRDVELDKSDESANDVTSGIQPNEAREQPGHMTHIQVDRVGDDDLCASQPSHGPSTAKGSSSRRAMEESKTPTRSAGQRNDSGLQQASGTHGRFMSQEGGVHPESSAVCDVNNAGFQTPRRPSRSTGPPTTPKSSALVLEELAPLKGAAEDPDRDYLEPLFRIQAHETPNSRTTALPNLTSSASKSLSTQDHFISSHERLDFRILRRVYQLQNANKWSLRQMQRAKEFEQPVTHWDHMMAEMKWMRKDFKAERKMRTSVCAWLARRCADWVAADAKERTLLQVKTKPPRQKSEETADEQVPELEQSGDSAPEDEASPPTPLQRPTLPTMLVVPSELSDTVCQLQKSGKLSEALRSLPVSGLSGYVDKQLPKQRAAPVSKFVSGKVLPNLAKPSRKRSRFDYEDDDAVPDGLVSKRARQERDLPPEENEIALFHPENKHIRDRLHANSAFRPPSEFVMPSTQFYEFRNGSQWIWEDDQKLRKLAKDYSFNWSLIADELTLPGSFKGSAERRTPWECFERWVDLEQLPAEMKKTMYFKTWYQRLEQSSQAADRRYQAQVAAIQAQNAGQAQNIPMRRRTVPSRVEKRRGSRYLWLVDAMRKNARKRETQAYKQAEAHRAAAQRKTQTTETQPRQPMMTPQEFSRKRHERDMVILEAQRAHRQKLMEAQKQNYLAQRQAAQQQQQQAMQNGVANAQRPGSSSNLPVQAAQMQVNGQQAQPMVNGQHAQPQLQQQSRPQVSVPTRNGHLAVPVNAQGVPQAQMRPNNHMPGQQDMQRIAQANMQARSQYGGQQPYQQLPSANMQSPGGGINPQQQYQSNQAMLAAMQQQQQQQQQPAHVNHAAGMQQQHVPNVHQGSGSPSMPPPPQPQKALSSGLVPAYTALQSSLRASYPQANEEQIKSMATEMLKAKTSSTNQTRQNAMNAAAGVNGGVAPQPHANMQAYVHNQAAFANGQMANGNHAAYTGGDTNGQPQANMSPASPQQYAAMMKQRQMQQMRMSPNANHATVNGSPSIANGSPQMAPVSPNMQYANVMHGQQMAQMNAMGGMPNQRPPSRSATPQMQRLGSSGSVPTMQQGMQSPGLQVQGSPRNMQASMAR